jgi:hypothetical protein
MTDERSSARPPAPNAPSGRDRFGDAAAEVRSRFVLLFLAGAVLFNFPLLSLFNHDRLLGGIPLIVAAVFGIWTALIATTAVLTLRSQRNRPDG